MIYNHKMRGHRPHYLLPTEEKIRAVSLETVEKCYKCLDADNQIDYLVTVIRCASLVGGKKARSLADKAVTLAAETPSGKNEDSLNSLTHSIRMYASEKEWALFNVAKNKIRPAQQQIHHPAPDHLV